MKPKANPFLLIVITTLIWSTSGAFVKSLQITPTSFAFIRMIVPALFFLPFLGQQARKIHLFENRMMLSASFLNVFRLFLFFNAYTYAPLGAAAVLLNSWPIFANLFSFFLLGEALTKRNVSLLFVALAGIILVNIDKEFSLESQEALGLLSAMGCAMVNALSIVIFKKESSRYSWQETIFYQNLIGIGIFAPFFFFLNPMPSTLQLTGAIFFAFIIGVIAYGFFFYALRYVKASTASLLAYLEVVGAIVIGVVLFDEHITWNLILGCILILTSSILVRNK